MKANKEEVVEMKTYQIETRVALLEQSIDHIKESLTRMEDKSDKKFYELQMQIIDLRKDTAAQFKWLFGTVILGFLAPILLKIFHVI